MSLRSITITLVLLAVHYSGMASMQWTDDELCGENAPLTVSYDGPPPPDEFLGPNEISLISNKENGPHICISANKDRPVPVSFQVENRDSTLLVTVDVLQAGMRQSLPRYSLPSDDFMINVIYPRNLIDTAQFHMYKTDSVGWRIEAVTETAFIRLGR